MTIEKGKNLAIIILLAVIGIIILAWFLKPSKNNTKESDEKIARLEYERDRALQIADSAVTSSNRKFELAFEYVQEARSIKRSVDNLIRNINENSNDIYNLSDDSTFKYSSDWLAQEMGYK